MDHKCSKEVEINDIHQIITHREQEIKEIKDMLKGIDKAIRGNGTPGISTTIAVLKNTVGGVLAINIMIIAALIKLWIEE